MKLFNINKFQFIFFQKIFNLLHTLKNVQYKTLFVSLLRIFQIINQYIQYHEKKVYKPMILLISPHTKNDEIFTFSNIISIPYIAKIWVRGLLSNWSTTKLSRLRYLRWKKWGIRQKASKKEKRVLYFKLLRLRKYTGIKDLTEVPPLVISWNSLKKGNILINECKSAGTSLLFLSSHFLHKANKSYHKKRQYSNYLQASNTRFSFIYQAAFLSLIYIWFKSYYISLINYIKYIWKFPGIIKSLKEAINVLEFKKERIRKTRRFTRKWLTFFEKYYNAMLELANRNVSQRIIELKTIKDDLEEKLSRVYACFDNNNYQTNLLFTSFIKNYK